MEPCDVLVRHLGLCEDVHALLLEENTWLKTQKTSPEESLLERKKAILPKLDESLSNLKRLQPELFSPFDDVRQSTFYLPFAMGDTDAGARQRVLWSDVKSAMETFDETLASANRFDAELEDVLLDMDRLWRAVDAFFMAAAAD